MTDMPDFRLFSTGYTYAVDGEPIVERLTSSRLRRLFAHTLTVEHRAKYTRVTVFGPTLKRDGTRGPWRTVDWWIGGPLGEGVGAPAWVLSIVDRTRP